MGIYDRDHRQNDPWKKTPQDVKQYKLNDFKNIKSQKIREYKPASKWIFIIPIVIFIVASIIKNAYHETNEPAQQISQIAEAAEPVQQNNQVVYRTPTPEEEKAYMEENHLIKIGNDYYWCGIKESRDILPITKALDMDCQNDFCRIQKYYDYVKKIPYEKGTQNKNKNATDVVVEWKGDCDERSYLLASMMLANGYKTILLYTKDHTLTALNIPNYESNDNRSYVQYEGRKYYIAETTDPNGQIGTYNNETMHSLKYVYDVNQKKVASSQEVNIQLYR